MARPSKYKDDYPDQAFKLCLLGATDMQLADFFEVSITTIYNWKNDHSEFLDALNRAKSIQDQEVEKSLLQRAMGYVTKETKVFCYKGEILSEEVDKYYPPDSTALIFWLKNRQPEKWRDKRDVNLESEDPISLSVTINKKE